MANLNRLRALTRQIDAATPAGRDRAVDALRACAILGVVLGHWLVTALVAKPGGAGAVGTLTGDSPLRHIPWLAPISWIFQTLAVFFLVGGHVAAKSYASAAKRGMGYGAWVRQRLIRLARPVAAVLGLWTVIGGTLLIFGAPPETVRALTKLVLSPLWFLLVFAGLTVVTPLVARLHWLWPLAAVMQVDLIRFGFGGPAWTGWINVIAGWLVPYCLGTAWTRGEYARPTSGLGLLIGGAAATTGLVQWGGYPASMVGVPGAEISNLNPPTLAAVTFGLAQAGLALLLREPLRRAMRRPCAWTAILLANLSAMTIFLWHQTAMMAVTSIFLPLGTVPGLHTAPDSLGWALARLAWVPVFAGALAMCWAAFRMAEQPARAGLARGRPAPKEKAALGASAAAPRGEMSKVDPMSTAGEAG
ncbi:acyltransferase [Streptomyces noursei]|uniref:acyltransferase family protein n=1 Tax=Streptomyces TaxID=1883 RepID=UPI0035DA379A